MVIGPLSQVVGTDEAGEQMSLPGGDPPWTANALTILRRAAVAVPAGDRGGSPKLDDTAARNWATRTWLGQRGPDKEPSPLTRAVIRRRVVAIHALTEGPGRSNGDGAAGPKPGCFLIRLRPDGPVLVGAAEGGIRDVGMSLHGTYGWPIIPGSALKGAAHAYARDEEGMEAGERERIFGSPRPGDDGISEEAARGGVTFLDALPAAGDLEIAEDVLTPHAKEYYINGKPPAEYWQPVPVPFLTVRAGDWWTFCLGSPEDAHTAARLLAAAAVTIGLGAKTAAGYGYMDEAVATPLDAGAASQ
jgi:CRISPR-associated protein Cmr6